MTAVYLDSQSLEVYLNGVWTDITSDVVGNISANWGISGNAPTNRVAQGGMMGFTLNNLTKKYTPGSATANSGWKKGAAVRLTLTYDTVSYRRFRGYIDGITPTSGEFGLRQAHVTCMDWMQVASDFPIILAQSYTNKRADEGVNLVLASMPIPPQATSLSQGNETFNIIFDTVKQSTTALAEFAKLMMSEFGYLYLRKDKTYGETLVMEAKHDRDGFTLSQIPQPSSNQSFLLLETGDHLLLETGDKLILDINLLMDIAFDNLMTSLETEYGQSYFNRVSVRNYPRQVGTSLAVLFSLNSPIQLTSGETKGNIRGTYIDPTAGGTTINGQSMVVPVSGTDYQMFANQDGTGADLTANLVISGTYGTESVVYALSNTGSQTGYVTKLQARGYPVFVYNPIEQYIEDAASILQSGGVKVLTIDQKYSAYLLPNIGLAQIILGQTKDAKLIANRINLIANTSYDLMVAFLNFDVGSIISVTEAQTSINSGYAIQDVKFEITPSGIILYSWGLKDMSSFSSSYWTLEVAGKSELESTTYVGY